MNKIAVIGGGPAGIMCSLYASQNPDNQIFIFDKGIILNTLLPTGGGRCNLAHAEFDFRELAKYYPRGEKFLYGLFSKFSTSDTLSFFENIGIETYTQDDNRIFPVSDSAKEVKNALLAQVDKQKNIKKIFENVSDIEKTDEGFKLKTNKNSHIFDTVVIATGGRGEGQKLAKSLGHNIVELKPALSSLITKEKNYTELSGLSLKNIEAEVFFENKKVKIPQSCLYGDFLFTHTGISGPLVYKISSYCAYLDFNKDKPLKISLNLVNKSFEQFDEEFLTALKTNAQKESANILSEFLPRNLAYRIFENEKINPKTKAGQLTKNDREKISKVVTDFVFNAVSVTKGEEIVTAGGVDLKEIDSKTMESKLVKNLFFCGEVLDIDGITGGFNLQNCWSTGFAAGTAISN